MEMMRITAPPPNQNSLTKPAISIRHKMANWTIATWNLQGLNESGKFEQTSLYMTKNKIDILMIQETHMNCNQLIKQKDHTFILSTSCETTTIPNPNLAAPNPNPKRRPRRAEVQNREFHGTGIVISNKLIRLVKSYTSHSGRHIQITFALHDRELTIHSAYAPTNDKPVQDKQAFYDHLTKQACRENGNINSRPTSHTIHIIMGDFNARLHAQLTG